MPADRRGAGGRAAGRRMRHAIVARSPYRAVVLMAGYAHTCIDGRISMKRALRNQAGAARANSRAGVVISLTAGARAKR